MLASRPYTEAEDSLQWVLVVTSTSFNPLLTQQGQEIHVQLLG